MFKVEYGTHEHKIDVTEVAYTKCTKSSILYIPSIDDARARLFPDPVYGKVKHIFLTNNGITKEYSSTVPIFINTVTNTVIENIEEIRNVYEDAYVDIKLQLIQSSLQIRHGSFRDECPEQKMAVRFLTGSEKVLEIGGNIGRTSVIISSILKSNNMVTLESDPTIAKKLQENRDLNNLSFHIESCALSMRPLIQRGWDTIVSDTVLDGYTKVKTISLEELKEKYQIPFDTLILDCEGAFFYILQDMPSILNGIKMLIMENDYFDITHKQFIDAKLKERGFQCVYTESLGPGWEHKKFTCEKEFFQVWKA